MERSRGAQDSLIVQTAYSNILTKEESILFPTERILTHDEMHALSIHFCCINIIECMYIQVHTILSSVHTYSVQVIPYDRIQRKTTLRLRDKGMVEFGRPTRIILAIAKDVGLPPASFNHIIDTNSFGVGHLEHAMWCRVLTLTLTSGP